MNSKSSISKKELSLLKQYQNMVDETNVVSKTDTRGIITYVNDKFVNVSGYSREELIGKPHSIVRDPDMSSTVFNNMWRTISSKKVWHGIITNLNKNGTKFTFKASVFPIFNESNEIIEYISIRHDLTELMSLYHKIDEINSYKTQQELLAKSKLEAGIVNDLDKDEYNVLHLASDILSGDFYSIYKMDNGSTFVYLVDGQGHGISPALTVFAISSMLNQFIYKMSSMDELISRLYPSAKDFLAEDEQLSYIMLMISPDKKTITYSAGGMYPFLIKTPKEIIKIKSNNTPFMNFSDVPNCDSIEVKSWENIVLYSDGIVEHQNEELKDCSPENMISNTLNIQESLDKASAYNFDDDVTVININNLKKN
ncbi:SpoIIE family protein phosphatase [Sulfurimonas lithotrophica]|uniref:SpoIIE family protein phosphatase n=1 Tax=Sulfurimonas lithotrophica TaxID=2590022 RepID=A0A5P8P1W3_9BACT|nr:SpoIIE family protein phosphatase [Sulfurimonas lithotrophica]QFR49587.1 SpoIIE family protein phosphatase [Sulfurimonas lithotrophica]